MYKSSGLEDVSSKVLKDFLTLALREITMLYNRIIVTGIFPDKWKIATVTPIPKIQNASNPTELRPISLLPVPGKLLEKFISKKLTIYLEENKYFTENQFGFRKNKSTSSALTTVLDDVIDQLNEAKVNIVAYLDFQKAFDTINHGLLLNKLRNAGVGGNTLRLLENYLTNRKQRTKLHSATSTLKPVPIEVPQGSTVGPLMFIVFINDLPKVLENSNAVMYADDTVVYCGDISEKVARKQMQSDLDRVQQWCNRNRLTLNVVKTKIMTFMSDHKRKSYKQFRLYMRGMLVNEVDSYKYLGTLIDNRLNGDPQYDKLTKHLGFKIRTFGKIRRYLNTRAALMVYKSTILPIIDYNDYFQFLWNGNKTHRLQKFQNWALRVVFSEVQPRLNEGELHLAAGLDLLSTRRINHLLFLMYNRSKNPDLLDNRDLPTRQFDKVKFKVINPNIKKAFKLPNYLGAQLWDMLPKETQKMPTLHKFKNEVAKHVKNALFENAKV